MLSPDLLDFIVLLNECGVECVLVGGYALGVHGVIRATGDIDFFFRRTRKNVARLCRAMEAFGAPEDIIDAEVLLTPEMIVHFGQPPNRIDLLNAIDGVSFEEVWAGASINELSGQQLHVIGLGELRKNKRATGRTKDAADLKRLATLSRRKRRS
jgi:hypothetical protein